jgi:NADH:ubiquinone oxidoreductase subunit H
MEGILYGLSIGIKLNILMFSFIWIRASFPRFTYDNLTRLCWVIILPILFGLFILVPSILYTFDSLTLSI